MLAAELAPADIAVNAVCPTAVDTPVTDDIIDEMTEDLAETAAHIQPNTLFDEILYRKT